MHRKGLPDGIQDHSKLELPLSQIRNFARLKCLLGIDYLLLNTLDYHVVHIINFACMAFLELPWD